MLRVGLTGGIACGKSHVLRRLAARGIATLDLDQVSRAVVAPGEPALDEIARAFGPQVVGRDGALDRAALAAIVFADASAREHLNAIVHPRVRAAEAAWAAERAAAGAPVAVTDAALLVESGAHLRFDRIVVVHCDAAAQLARLQARDGLDERAALSRVAAQMPVAEKRAFGHFTLDTTGAVADTEARADALADALHALAQRPRTPPLAAERLAAVVESGPSAGPRGLSPRALLFAAADDGGLEMDALAARLVPPARSWLQAAASATPGEPAAALVPALVAWALARQASADVDYLASAAGSLARLTHEDAPERAAACLAALVLRESLMDPAAADVARLTARFAPLAERWGGATPPPWPAALDRALRVALGGVAPAAEGAVVAALRRIAAR